MSFTLRITQDVKVSYGTLIKYMKEEFDSEVNGDDMIRDVWNRIMKDLDGKRVIPVKARHLDTDDAWSAYDYKIRSILAQIGEEMREKEKEKPAEKTPDLFTRLVRIGGLKVLRNKSMIYSKWFGEPLEAYLMLDFVLMDTKFLVEMIKASNSNFWMSYGSAKEYEVFDNRDAEDCPKEKDGTEDWDYLSEELFKKYVGEHAESVGLTWPLYLEMKKSEVLVRLAKEACYS